MTRRGLRNTSNCIKAVSYTHLAVPHGHGQLDHGQYGVIGFRRFRGGGDVMAAAASAVSTASTGIGFHSDGTGGRFAPVRGGDGYGGRTLFDGGQDVYKRQVLP